MRDPHVVYYCYDAQGRMIYVGCTKDIYQRFLYHHCNSPWVHLLAKIRCKIFDGKVSARHHEERAISRNRPAFNKTCRLRPHGKRLIYDPVKELDKQKATARPVEYTASFKEIARRAAERVAARVEKERVAE